MQVDAAKEGWDFWGYAPLSYNYVKGKQIGDAATRKVEAKRIRENGYRSSRYGYTDKENAVAAAKVIEEATGVLMHVFPHSYL